MVVSKNCVDLVKRFEGFRGMPYLCPAGIPTIGYGSTFYPNGKKVTMKDSGITESEATEMLRYTLDKIFAPGVSKALKVEVKQNQFDALCSFAYNLGVAALAGSTLMKKLNVGDIAGAGKEFDKWVKAGGKVLNGLVARRAAERKLYEQGTI